MLDLGVTFAYFVALLAIGRWSARRIRSTEDFYLCGRSLGKLPAALSLAATEFSGSGLIGGAGLAYAIGVAGAYWNLVAVPALILLGFTVAVALQKLTLYTLPELLGARYGPHARRLTALLQLTEGTVFLAVQILVSAITVSTLFGIPRVAAALVVTIVFMIYTASGGLWAVVWTDVFQYVILMAGVLIGLPLALAKAGGLAGLRSGLPAEHFDLTRLGWMEPLAWMALCFYSYGTDQTYLQRVFSTRDAATARFSYVFTGVSYVVFGFCVVGMGMAAAVLLPGLPAQDEAMPALIAHVLPRGLRGFFLTAILATTMSTASAWLSACSSLIIKDLYEPLRGEPVGDRRLLLLSRLSTVVIAGGALAIALAAPGVVDAVVFSTIVAPAAAFLPALAALYWKRVSHHAGFWALLSGAATGVVSQLALYQKVAGLAGAIHPLFLGPAVGLLVLVALSLRSSQPLAPPPP